MSPEQVAGLWLTIVGNFMLGFGFFTLAFRIAQWRRDHHEGNKP